MGLNACCSEAGIAQLGVSATINVTSLKPSQDRQHPRSAMDGMGIDLIYWAVAPLRRWNKINPEHLQALWKQTVARATAERHAPPPRCHVAFTQAVEQRPLSVYAELTQSSERVEEVAG